MNNNLQEDYCSFEVSKLLKEKGFDAACWYWDFEKVGEMSVRKPTHALAIKWIRENFGINIHIHSEVKLNGLEITNISKYQANIVRLNTVYTFGKKSKDDIPDGDFRKPRDKPEEATETALLYTLKNLI